MTQFYPDFKLSDFFVCPVNQAFFAFRLNSNE